MTRIIIRVACICAALVALTLAPCVAEDFLVTENEPASSSSAWLRLFGEPEPNYAGEDDADKTDAYEAALSRLADNSVIDAMNGFAKLGKYREAARLTNYCAARLSYLRGEMRTARAAFEAMGDFADAPYQKKLCDAMAVHRVYENGKFGYVSLDGGTVIEPAYDWAERVFRDEGRAPEADGRVASLMPVAAVFNGSVELTDGGLQPREGLYGLLRRDGRLIAPVSYDAVLWVKGGLAALERDGRAELISTVSGERLGQGFDEVSEYSQGFVPVRTGNKWGYIDADGEYLNGGLIWDAAMPFSEGYAAVAVGGEYGYIDLSGDIVIEPQYQNARAFSEGLAAVRLKKRWGFINENGATVIEHAYQDAGIFSEGACAVKKGEKYGLIDAENRLLLYCKYDEITPFDPVYHRAWVRMNKLWGLVNPDGNLILAPAWGTWTPFYSNGLSLVSYRGKYGYIDAMGVTLIENVYDAAAPFSAGRGGVLNADGQTEYLDRFSRGFIIESDAPSEALCGFIEGYRITETRLADAESGEERSERRIAYRLYETDGTPITNWSD